MSKLSDESIKTIKANIIRLLYDEYPQPLSATEIGKYEARDKQFVLRLLHELSKDNLVKPLKKTRQGKPFLRKQKWTLSNNYYNFYKKQ